VNPWLQILLAAMTLAGAGGGIYSAATVKAQKAKLTAEAETLKARKDIDLTAAARELVDPLRERVRELEAEVRDLRAEQRTLRAASDEADVLRARLVRRELEIDELRAQLRALQAGG
jgi:polyhydroxyalkanoate synthesis regulator phasin